MATLDISLPDGLKHWVEAQARGSEYVDAGDYIRALIRRDRERSEALAEVQGLIDEGLASGVSERSMQDVLEIARKRAAEAIGG